MQRSVQTSHLETRTNIHVIQSHLSLFMTHPFIYATADNIYAPPNDDAEELQSLDFKNSTLIMIDISQLTLLSKFLLWERVVSKDFSGVVNLERGSHSSIGSNTWALCRKL